MFIERIRENFKCDEPIFADEIVRLFSEFTEAYIYRLIKKAEKCGDIIKFSNGVYYIPQKTFFGMSTITADDVIRKKYIGSGGDIYGIYGGIKLLNSFSATTQVANTIEIVTNNETTRKRIIELDGRKFVLRKSRCPITSNNADAYAVIQFFSELDKDEELSELSKRKVLEYINGCSISAESLKNMAKIFPAKAAKNLLMSEVLDEIA